MLENKTKEALETLTVPCFHTGRLSDHAFQWANTRRSLDVDRSFRSCHKVAVRVNVCSDFRITDLRMHVP